MCSCSPMKPHGPYCEQTPIYATLHDGMLTDPMPSPWETWERWTRFTHVCSRCGRSLGDINGPKHYCLRDREVVAAPGLPLRR